MTKKSTQKPRMKSSKDSIKLPTVKELLEAGAHFGHEVKRWNPKFSEFVYAKRGSFHIIDLEKTLEKLKQALEFVQKAAVDGDIVMVGTKRQARDVVREEAIRCGAHFVVNRWVGGQITNFETIRKGINRLREIEKELGGEDIDKYTQQELSILRREWSRLDRLFGGVKTLEKLPDAVVIIDANYEKIALKEASKGGVSIVAMVDSNTDPNDIDYPIPANDDAIKSVQLFVRYIADAILAGNKGKGVQHEFKDLGRVGVKESDTKEIETKKQKKVAVKGKVRGGKSKEEKPKEARKKKENGKKIKKGKKEKKERKASRGKK